jgi:hypothetical protein
MMIWSEVKVSFARWEGTSCPHTSLSWTRACYLRLDGYVVDHTSFTVASDTQTEEQTKVEPSPIKLSQAML